MGKIQSPYASATCLRYEKGSVFWHGAYSPVEKMEYKKNWEIFVESWSWFPLLMGRPIEKDPDSEFLAQYILLRHIFIFSFVFIYMQLEHFLWHVLNHDKRTLHLTSELIFKNFLLTSLLQDRAYRFILKIFIIKGLRCSWWSDWSYSTLTLHQVHYLAKWGKTQLS